MDGIDGLKLVKKGKTVNRPLPFILICGYGTAQTAASAAKEGADLFLMKPSNMKEMKELKLAVKRRFGNNQRSYLENQFQSVKERSNAPISRIGRSHQSCNRLAICRQKGGLSNNRQPIYTSFSCSI
jgi:DNA-binding NtrC family response regulator